MSESDNGKIACIFEEERVFLTKSGKFYGYENVGGVFKCRRLNSIEINRFLYRLGDDKEVMVMATPKRRPLPRKYEDMSAWEI